jgi:adenylate cyclase
MSFDVFRKEAEVISVAKALIEAGEAGNEEDEAHYRALLKDFERLFKSTKRLVRVSDRNEEQLNAVAHSLDEKNKMLETLPERLSKYLEPKVYASIFSGDREVEITTERKKLTIFFSDIKDFTQTTDDLQPEDLTYLLNSYFTEMSNIAFEHGGTIDKFIGDSIMIFFGDPESLGVREDAKACLRMALAMQRKMVELRAKWRDRGYEQPFFTRMGINTGYCNVGNFGSDSKMDYTAIGGEVNLAARLESQADPGGILVSYETFAMVRDMVTAEEQPPIHAKGIRREVRPFAITGVQDEREPAQNLLRRERDGMLLVLDLEKLQGKDRESAVADLEEVVRDLRGKPAPKNKKKT